MSEVIINKWGSDDYVVRFTETDKYGLEWQVYVPFIPSLTEAHNYIKTVLGFSGTVTIAEGGN